jgi:hypothetical protein
VFQRGSADTYVPKAGRRTDVERWRATSVSTHAEAPGTFLVLRFRADQGAALSRMDDLTIHSEVVTPRVVPPLERSYSNNQYGNIGP